MQASPPQLVALEAGADSSECSVDGEDNIDEEAACTENGVHAGQASDGMLQTPSKRAKLRGIGHKAKDKAKRLLSVNDTKVLAGDGEVLKGIRRDPAFSPGSLKDTQRKTKPESATSAAAILASAGSVIAHPVEAIKSKATRTTAGKLAKVQRPFLSADADLDFLEAHDELDRVESTRTSKRATSDDDRDSLVEEQKEKIEQLKAQRESLRVAWTTTRFVKRVRVVPKRHLDFPEREAFVKDASEKKIWARYDWLKWIGHVRLDLLPIGEANEHYAHCILGTRMVYSRFQRSVYR